MGINSYDNLSVVVAMGHLDLLNVYKSVCVWERSHPM